MAPRAAALATIGVIEEEGLVARAASVGAAFQKQLAAFVGKYSHVKEVRGKGLMVGMVLDEAAKPFVNSLIEKGLITIATADKVVRFLPPLNVKDTEIEEAVEIIEEALTEWHTPAEEKTEEPAAPTA